MLVLLDTNNDLSVCEDEIGCKCEQLITPLTRFSLTRPEGRFAVDNGSFSRFNATYFLNLLKRENARKAQCIFVAVPDVVGSARRTLEVFDIWKHKLDTWPLALVAQDGQEHLPIPWSELSAIFIGGTTDWKIGTHAAQIIKAAKALDVWVHVGRVNDPKRFQYFVDLDVDSIDGSGLAQYSHMREAIAARDKQLALI